MSASSPSTLLPQKKQTMFSLSPALLPPKKRSKEWMEPPPPAAAAAKAIMNVCFEPTNGNTRFFMEIQFTDVVARVKEKIQQETGIPIYRQTLIFQDKLLEDDVVCGSSGLFECRYPRILVVQTYVPDDRLLLTDQLPVTPPPVSKKVQILMKMPVSKVWHCVEIDLIHTVKKLKEIIKELDGIPVSRIVLKSSEGVELGDEERLEECNIFDFVQVSCRRPGRSASRPPLPPHIRRNLPPLPPHIHRNLPPLPPHIHRNLPPFLPGRTIIPKKKPRIRIKFTRKTPSAPVLHDDPAMKNLKQLADLAQLATEQEEAISPDGMMTLFLAASPGGRKIPVKVLAAENVAVLRQECERIKAELPEDLREFVFRYQGEVLDEDQTFLSQSVRNGATIHIFEN